MNHELQGPQLPADGAIDADAGHEDAIVHLQRTLDSLAEGRLAPAARGVTSWRPVGNYTRAGERGKEVLDRVLAALGLIAISPLLLGLAIAIRLDSAGPAFFHQVRIGRQGKPFRFWKFRGMYKDARERFPELYDYRYDAEQARTLRFHPPSDPRVTPLGHFIRRTSLDELPNLINVVLGDMSLVGPRPEIPELVPYYGASAKVILSVKPGITSLAKLLGRDNLTLEETLELDVRYVRERSLRLDVSILMGTVWMIVTGRNVGS